MGHEFGIRFEIREVADDISLYFFLTKNGNTIDLPEELKNEGSEDVPLSFDNMTLAFLVQWDSSAAAGRYGVTAEVNNEEQCRTSAVLFLEQSFELWEDHRF